MDARKVKLNLLPIVILCVLSQAAGLFLLMTQHCQMP